MAGTTDWFAVLTLTMPSGGGVATGTKSAVLTVGPDATRAAILDHMRGLFPPEFAHANVVFFSAEPNRIGGER